MTRARSSGATSKLLRYEQDQIIGDDYDAIRNHSEVTWLSTLGMSVAPKPRPRRRWRPCGHPGLPRRWPALNNVSIFDKRWQWIQRDMYPAWVELVDSGAAGDLVATPFGDLAAERRTIPDSWLRYEPAG